MLGRVLEEDGANCVQFTPWVLIRKQGEGPITNSTVLGLCQEHISDNHSKDWDPRMRTHPMCCLDSSVRAQPSTAMS